MSVIRIILKMMNMFKRAFFLLTTNFVMVACFSQGVPQNRTDLEKQRELTLTIEGAAGRRRRAPLELMLKWPWTIV